MKGMWLYGVYRKGMKGEVMGPSSREFSSFVSLDSVGSGVMEESSSSPYTSLSGISPLLSYPPPCRAKIAVILDFGNRNAFLDKMGQCLTRSING